MAEAKVCIITGAGGSYLYQVLNPTLGLISPTDGNSTSIQGTVSDATVPEPELSPRFSREGGRQHV